jgi:hypothetical protein
MFAIDVAVSMRLYVFSIGIDYVAFSTLLWIVPIWFAKGELNVRGTFKYLKYFIFKHKSVKKFSMPLLDRIIRRM